MEYPTHFEESISFIGHSALEHCIKHGFDVSNKAEQLLLIHSEISEAAECLRKDDKQSGHIKNYLAIEEELADAVIRICNYCYANDLRLANAILEKLEFNKTREFRHGGKKF